jgi:Ca2+-binding EF-hand superfamily protein
MVDFKEFVKVLSTFQQKAVNNSEGMSKEEDKLRFLFRVYDWRDGALDYFHNKKLELF